MENPMDLTGKIIMVAGAGNDIGAAISNKLHLLGAALVLIDNNEDDLRWFRSLENCTCYSFKLFENNEIEPNINIITANKNPFNGMVFCTGIGGARPVSLLKRSDLDFMMNANFYSFIELIRCITKKGNFVDGGSIVAVSSVSSIKGLRSKTAYSASKAAMDASVRCLAAEFSDRRIRINSILKSWVASDLKNEYVKTNMNLNNHDLMKQKLGLINPDEIANLTAFLLSDATKTITGASILIDGGYTL